MKNILLFISLFFALSLHAQQKESEQGLQIDIDRIEMNEYENRMVEEINLVRTKPEYYIPFVEAYAKESQDKPEQVEEAKALIMFLQTAKPLPALKPMPCLYEAARNHAAELAPKGQLNHTGADGSRSWDRIFSACAEQGVADPNNENNFAQNAGSENIGTYSMGNSKGYEDNDPRKVNIMLLCGDFGRENIFNPDWNYVGTFSYNDKKEEYMEKYELTMYQVTYYWIQSFARGK